MNFAASLTITNLRQKNLLNSVYFAVERSKALQDSIFPRKVLKIKWQMHIRLIFLSYLIHPHFHNPHPAAVVRDTPESIE
jgi:hypothetical protein